MLLLSVILSQQQTQNLNSHASPKWPTLSIVMVMVNELVFYYIVWGNDMRSTTCTSSANARIIKCFLCLVESTEVVEYTVCCKQHSSVIYRTNFKEVLKVHLFLVCKVWFRRRIQRNVKHKPTGLQGWKKEVGLGTCRCPWLSEGHCLLK